MFGCAVTALVFVLLGGGGYCRHEVDVQQEREGEMPQIITGSGALPFLNIRTGVSAP